MEAQSSYVQQSEILKDIRSVLENLKNDMSSIKTQASGNVKITPKQAPDKTPKMNKKNEDTEYIDKVSVEITNTDVDYDSVASSDEFVPEIQEVPLNCENLTIQQTLLML